jgi:hypothetical protein
MKHPRRVGLAINDKDMKFIKKLLKKNPIIFEGSIRNTDDCIVQITNIRKYDDYWKYTCDKKFVYEIDIKVKKNNNYRYIDLYNDTRYKNRRMRGYSMEKLFLEELSYFNIKDICISKISYE